MSDDLDLFPDLVAEEPRQPVGEPFARAMEEHEAMVASEMSRRHHAEVATASQPVAVIWPSRRGEGQPPHIVTTALFRCTCEAAVLGNRDCWAVKATKELLGA